MTLEGVDVAVEVDDEATVASAGSAPGVLAGWDRRRTLRVLGELALMLLPLAPYQLLTMLPEPAGPAVAHGREILALEQHLGLAVERVLFETTAARPALLAVAHAYYEAGHFVGVALAALLLAGVAPARWVVLRSAFVLSTLMALVVFRLDPTAPPNLLPGTVFTTVPTRNPPDPFAAMPSVHIAWTLWAVLATCVAAPNLGRRGGRAGGLAAVGVALAVVHLALMVLVVLGTGHHYVLDAVAGAVDLGAGLALAVLGHELLRRRRPRKHTAP
jgi:hypothetical protein